MTRGRCRDEVYAHGGLGGGSNRPTYIVWRNMIVRCTNENHKQFKDYGGRGITVCDRWLNGFAHFLEDMGVRPNGLTLDRENNDLGYSPDNCRWATKREQSLNTTRSLILVFNGESKTAHEWAEQIGMTPKAFRWRIYAGWSVERAITTPVGAR